MHVDRRLLGWGLFFILLGTIPLLVKAGLLDAALVGQWPLLWPVLLIGWGLGLLLRNTPLAVIGGAVSVITFGIMGGSAIAAGFGGVPVAGGCSNSSSATPFTSQSGQLAPSARAEIEFSCGSLSVTTADGNAWSIAGTDRNGTGPTIDTTGGGVSLRSAAVRNLLGSSGQAVWNVTLPKSPALDLGLTLNAGDGTVRLPGANVSSASMTLNAGALTVDLGGATSAGDVNATVNAGSLALALPTGSRSVNGSVNAGSLKVCVPVGTPLRVEWSSALGSNNFDGAGLTKVGNNTWESPSLNNAMPFSELHVSANAGSFEVQFGGSCNA